MRGKAVDWGSMFQPLGITPAYAGKRNVLFCTLPGVQDHPRLCGEKMF